MIDEKMMKIAKIRNSYAMKKFGTLSYEEKALLDYDSFCIELIKENQKYKEVIDRAIEYMKDFIFEPLLTNEDRKLIMYNDNLRNFEKILKEVE